MKIEKQLSRKQLRKQKKFQKKQRIRNYHQNKSHKDISTSVKNNPIIQNKKKVKINDQYKIRKQSIQQIKQKTKKINKKQKTKQKIQQQYDSQDQRIAMYEKKLRIKGDDKQYNKLAKKMGFDNDLFNFLNNISKKVKLTQEEYQNERQREQSGQFQENYEDIQNQENMEEQELEGYQNQMMDMLNQQFAQESQQITQKSKNKQKQKTKGSKSQLVTKNKIKNQQELKNRIKTQQISEQPTKRAQSAIPSNQNIEVHKKMNSLFNKVSDGNLLITLRQFISIFQSYSKSITHPTFATLFKKFNLLIQKPLVHVMSANIVIAVSLHRIYGDKLMAHILYQLTQGFSKLQKQQQNLLQIQQIGYSRIFQKKKNYITIVCFLYQFQSISAMFVQTLVLYLTKNSTNKENIELIYNIVQKIGAKMRNNDPGALKEVIEILKKMIEQSKKLGTYQTTKIKFIQIQINQIRFNKKGIFDADQRMGFLHTFLNKTIKQQAPNEVRILDVAFDQFCKTLDIGKHDFWILQNPNKQYQEENKGKININQQNQEIKALIQLAKEMHFVTQNKRNIFISLMSSQDYIEATKKILQLRNRKLQDVATVLVEVNVQQSAFNPFYVLVAAKIAQQIPKFRVCLQFAIWDRLKQVLTFQPRKISNLGKFSGWLVSLQHANSSLSILKYFPDLLNVKSSEDIFLKVFFKQLFKKSSKQWITSLANKLKDEKNKVIRDGVKDYISELIQSLQNSKQKQNALLLKRLLAIQFQTQIEND